MITENDIKLLKRHETQMGKFEYWLLIFAPLFFIVIGCLNLWFAFLLGNSQGYNLGYLFQGVIEGINLNQQYSGLYLTALERLEVALFEFGLAIFFLLMFYSYNRRRRVDMRVLETLRQSGAAN